MSNHLAVVDLMAENGRLTVEIEALRKEVEAHVGRLLRENEALRKALEPVAALAYYINNPSAWERFDDEMSERLRPIVAAAITAIALKGIA